MGEYMNKYRYRHRSTGFGAVPAQKPKWHTCGGCGASDCNECNGNG